MNPLIAASAVQAGGSLLGSLSSGALSSAEARRARKWQQYMARNAHQMEVADLKAAGLNPILSAGGSGAHAPGTSSPTWPDMGSAVGQGVSSAIALKSAKEELRTKAATRESAELDTMAKREMWKYFAENPHIRGLLMPAMLAQMAGLSPTVFGSLGAVTSKGVRGVLSGLTKKAVDRGVEPAVKAYYDKYLDPQKMFEEAFGGSPRLRRYNDAKALFERR